MKKFQHLTYILILIVLVSGCVKSVPTIEPAQAPQVPADGSGSEAGPQATIGPPAEPGSEAAPAPESAAPPEPGQPAPGEGLQVSRAGLQILYIKGRDLWSWTYQGPTSQLTDMGDLSTVSVSADGGLIGFMREAEVWTVRMDGSDPRVVDPQGPPVGALWFAPNGASLAVSTGDHIDVIDLVGGTKTEVVRYAPIPGGYHPQVVWTPDSSGFKTVIPGSTENIPAEMLFVFTNAVVASLAKHPMVSIADSAPLISPDGGYVIYSALLPDGNQSLHLMDASGATRPYGDPAARVAPKGWAPDSQHFAYEWVEPAKDFVGNVGGAVTEVQMAIPGAITWIDSSQFVGIQDGRLMVGDQNGATLQIDETVSAYALVPAQ